MHSCKRNIPNGDALRKCILKGPYTPIIVTTPAVPATENSLAVPKQTTAKTVMNMTPENRAHFESKKEAIHLILTGIGDEIYLTIDACQTAQEMWEAIERLQQGLVYLETYILFIDKYGYIKNHKKTVKNEQARTREPEEYKAEARKAKPQSKSAKGIEREGLKVQICQSPITRMTLELANRSITHPMGIAEDVVVKVDGFTFHADFVVVSFEPDPRVPIILGRPFLGTAKALIDLYEEKLTLRVGKDELVYYADKSEKNKEKNCVHAISIIDFSKDNPFSGNTTNTLPPSSSPMKTSDNFEKFSDELAPLGSLPPGNDDSTFKKDFHEVNFQVYSNTLFEFDDNFKSGNVNPLFEEHDKDGRIMFLLPSHLLHRKMMYRVLIRRKILCLLATYLHKKPKPPQEVQKVEMKDNEVSSEIPIDVIVMPIRITFDNPIDFNDHFSKPKDLKKDLTISFDSTTTSILPHPLLDSDSPFTAELSASEAECVALSASCAQVMWMRTQLQDYGALSEDRFQYLVRRIGMRCLTPAELEVLTNESA
ncbi:integrase, catalytic region, zinc finger, CCHC-type containing protein [Tanacetum coccineum]